MTRSNVEQKRSTEWTRGRARNRKERSRGSDAMATRAPIFSPGPLIKGQDDLADMHREFVVCSGPAQDPAPVHGMEIDVGCFRSVGRPGDKEVTSAAR
jgi:hypothetical protein